jgi:hypothetical protein
VNTKQSIADACYAIPAHFDHRFSIPVQQDKIHSLNQLRLGLRISAHVQQRNAAQILLMEKEMLRVLADTGYVATGQLLDKMVRLIANHDKKSALRFGYKLGGLLLNQVCLLALLVLCGALGNTSQHLQERHAEFRRITFLLLYPTIYDSINDVIGSSGHDDEDIEAELVCWPFVQPCATSVSQFWRAFVHQVESEDVNECLADVDTALEQLTLHRAVLQLLDERRASDKAENIVETVERFLVRHASSTSIDVCTR